MRNPPLKRQDVKQEYQVLVKQAAESAQLQLILEVNPDLAEQFKTSPDGVAQCFASMGQFLPKRVWSDPIVGGSILRHMCDEMINAGGVLLDQAQLWKDG